MRENIPIRDERSHNQEKKRHQLTHHHHHNNMKYILMKGILEVDQIYHEESSFSSLIYAVWE